MKLLSKAIAAAALVALPALAIAQHDHAHDNAQPANMTDADKALMAAHMTMMKDMDMKTTGNPDRDFVTMMIPHHQGAVDMAKVLLQYGKDPELKELAVRIIAEQEKEIAQMRAWGERNKN